MAGKSEISERLKNDMIGAKSAYSHQYYNFDSSSKNIMNTACQNVTLVVQKENMLHLVTDLCQIVDNGGWATVWSTWICHKWYIIYVNLLGKNEEKTLGLSCGDFWPENWLWDVTFF